jgi:hypothetical protein
MFVDTQEFDLLTLRQVRLSHLPERLILVSVNAINIQSLRDL